MAEFLMQHDSGGHAPLPPPVPPGMLVPGAGQGARNIALIVDAVGEVAGATGAPHATPRQEDSTATVVQAALRGNFCFRPVPVPMEPCVFFFARSSGVLWVI